MPVKPTKVDLATMTVDLATMTMDELRDLRHDINTEIDKRKQEEYDKAVEDFRAALFKLYSEFGDECCIINNYRGCDTTWEELYNDYDWNF